MHLFKPSKSSTTLYCFTPLVSLLTFIIEIALALYVFWKYKATTFSRLCIAILVCLGVFQLSEYLVCTTYTDRWILLGYVAITLLPALGVHIVSVITKRYPTLIASAYTLAALLVVIIVCVPQAGLHASCQPNYVDITSSPLFHIVHGTYYVSYIFIAMAILLYRLWQHRGDVIEEKWMLISYAVFVIPSIGLEYFKIIARVALPSVMCGFAILTAFIMVWILIPRYYRSLKKKRK